MLRKLLRWLSIRDGKSGLDSSFERDCLLRVFLNDAVCFLIAFDREEREILRDERMLPDGGGDGIAVLSSGLDQIPEGVQQRIGKVEIFLDDPEISVMDSRQAKLNHFEGRALAEFGRYQLGGKPVCFASQNFARSGVQEAEKRVIAYISEDRLTTILFTLGQLARYVTFFGPWTLQEMFVADTQDGWAQLSLQRGCSTIALANGSAGALAVRHLPFGARHIAESYASAFGISLSDAEKALAARSRLPAAGPETPQANTILSQSLNPVLESFAGEISSTADYFEFHRLAGRPQSLMLRTAGAGIAGLTEWLAKLLQIEVRHQDVQAQTGAVAPPALNMLEGMRAGLLKIGSQRFDFVGGQFVHSKDGDREVGKTKRSLAAKWKDVSSKPLTTASMKSLAKPAFAGLVGVAVCVAAYNLGLPGSDDLAGASSRYAAGVARLRPAIPAPKEAGTELRFWSNDLIVIAADMPYDMKLKTIVLAPTSSSGSSLEMTGSLPDDANDLQLLSRFISRLSTNTTLRRRFSEIKFAGAGNSKTEGEFAFKIVAKVESKS